MIYLIKIKLLNATQIKLSSSLTTSIRHYDNQFTEITLLLCISINTALVFLFENFCSFIFKSYVHHYKEWFDNDSSHVFANKVKDSSDMNKICPFNPRYVKAEDFFDISFIPK